MKLLNKISQIAAIVLGVGSIVLFFTEFAKFVTNAGEFSAVGAQLAFGSKIDVAGKAYDMAKSADILLCFWLTVIGAVMSIFSFKSKKLRYAAPGFGAVAGIYMLVIAIASPWKFIDIRPFDYSDVSALTHTPFVIITAIAILLFTIAAAAYLLIDDYLEVEASKGDKLTIPKRIVRFFRDYKSETKKIVWPGIKDVVKNTIIVLIICLLVGALIWVIDYGLGQLLNLILGLKK